MYVLDMVYIFSPSAVCQPIFLITYFEEQECFVLMKYNLSNVCFMVSAFCVFSEKVMKIFYFLLEAIVCFYL